MLNQGIGEKPVSVQKKPKAESIHQALLEAEKQAHQNKLKYDFQQLMGNWHLVFITGTKESKKKWSNVIGKGFYLPQFINVSINYYSDEKEVNQGKVVNQVNVGLVKFSVEGPIKYLEKKNILAFDFNYLKMYILGVQTYQTNIRGGENSTESFYRAKINQLAFFSYFLVTENLICARGRGGGLALWKKDNME
ncbi:MAG: hypothetical protein IGQ45_06990 [Cyanobacterium sp. T60_A2020_053]|nr:hypothetical protein [Cyanobacterium sp. T60_A2020_053]